IEKDVLKMMGPAGTVSSIASANQLVLQDTIGNLRRVYQTITDIEKKGEGQTQKLDWQCKFIKAKQAETILTKALGNPHDPIDLLQPQRGGGFGPGGGGFGPGGGGFGPGGGGFGQRTAAAITPKLRMHYITSDENSQTVIVTGPADKVNLAKQIMEKIDV